MLGITTTTTTTNATSNSNSNSVDPQDLHQIRVLQKIQNKAVLLTSYIISVKRFYLRRLRVR